MEEQGSCEDSIVVFQVWHGGHFYLTSVNKDGEMWRDKRYLRAKVSIT